MNLSDMTDEQIGRLARIIGPVMFILIVWLGVHYVIPVLVCWLREAACLPN